MTEITLQELCSSLEQLLDVQSYKDYCPNGLQVEGKPRIKKVAVAVSASLQTIQTAVDIEADALIVHHGIFWNGDPYPITGVKKRKIELLVHNNISLLAYHLPLDGNQQIGNNWKAALDLGWRDLSPCCMANGMPIGVAGTFEPLERTEFLTSLEKYYGHPAQSALGGKERVRSAMLVSGGAYKMLSEAAKAGIDCFITGNFDEPAWHDAFELGVNFYAMGHSATERVGPKALGNYIRDNWHIEVAFLDIYNPF